MVNPMDHVTDTIIRQLEQADAALLIATAYLERKAEQHPNMSVEIREVLLDILKKRVGEVLK